MKLDRSLRWRFLLGLVLSLALLVLAFWRTDATRIWGAIAAADRALLLVAFLLNFLGLILRAFRWRLLFVMDSGPRPFGAFLDGVNIGYLVNNLFPVRLGDVVRSVLVGRWLGSGASRALSATVVERVLDSALILLLLFSLLAVLPLPAVVVNIGLSMAAAVVSVLVVMVLAAGQRKRAARWFRRILETVPWIDSERWTDRLTGLIEGFQALRDGGALGRFLLWSLLVWAQTVAVFWLTMRAFEPQMPLAVAALATAAAALGLAAPSAPAGLGTFEGAVIGALILASIEENTARSMAIALHAIPFVSLNLAGLWSLARRGLGYRALVRAASGGKPVEGSALRG